MAAASRGMPGVAQTVVVDTGSATCRGCSATRRRTPSTTPPGRPRTPPSPAAPPRASGSAPTPTACYADKCQYRVTYADGSSTLGTYSSDVLTFSPTSAVTSFQFGCSQAEQGVGFDGRSSGTMGLGGGPESLVSQTAATHGNAFSYCGWWWTRAR